MFTQRAENLRFLFCPLLPSSAPEQSPLTLMLALFTVLPIFCKFIVDCRMGQGIDR